MRSTPSKFRLSEPRHSEYSEDWLEKRETEIPDDQAVLDSNTAQEICKSSRECKRPSFRVIYSLPDLVPLPRLRLDPVLVLLYPPYCHYPLVVRQEPCGRRVIREKEEKQQECYEGE